MIEVVYKGEDNAEQSNSEVKVPKNVRQIGEIGTGRKIYVEDYVMTYLKENSDNADKIKYGVLLGNTRRNSGNAYIFIKGLVEVTETIENSLIFNDEIWTGIYQDIKDYFDNFEIAGWYVSMPYRIKDDMAPIRKIHLDNFAGNDKICYVDDRSENEDGFYAFENGRMERQSGYYIYYEKNANMQRYINVKVNGHTAPEKGVSGRKGQAKKESDKSLVKKVINMTPGFLKNTQNKTLQSKPARSEADMGRTESGQESLRDIMKKQKRSSVKPGYAIGTVAVIALLLSTIAMMNNYGELRNIQQSLEELANDGQTIAVIGQVSENSDTDANDEADSESNNETASDAEVNADGDTGENNSKQSDGAENESADDLSADNQTSSESDLEEETSSSNLTGTGQDTYEDTDSAASSVSAEDYCIVKKGQTLYDISMTYYNTSSMVDAIKEANNIDDNYTIYEGEKIILP